ncbi:hypothetical protein HRbin02_00546 [Candidatus Calditenuaceae archaeon HR02]|nr:hypothetical protein HRbin02_00546 [Candidatus Calditenuaceae archaeon HR02]
MSIEERVRRVITECEEKIKSRTAQLTAEVERDSWSVLEKVLSGAKRREEKES